MKSRGAWIAIASALAVLLAWIGMGGGVWRGERAKSTTPPAAPSSWSDEASPIPVTSADPAWGDRDALVTLVLFVDLEDWVVVDLASTIKKLEARYGDRQLRIVWKHAPSAGHVNARDAAEAAAACFDLEGAPAFWHFVERALANQTMLSATSYATWASESKVDALQFHDGMSWHRWASKVADDERLAKSLGVSTPTAFVNGIATSLQPLSMLQDKIDDELTRARTDLWSHLAPNHAAVTHDGAAGLAPERSTTQCGPVPSRVSPAR